MNTDGGWQLTGTGWAPALHRLPEIRPGVIPLRPLGVGDIIGGVFTTLGRCTKAVYLPVLAAAGGAVGLLGLAFGAVAFALRDSEGGVAGRSLTRLPRLTWLTDGETAGLATPALVALAVSLVCLAVLYAVSYSTATTVVRYAVIGQEVTAHQVWQEARPFLGRVVLAQLLAGLASLVVLALSALPAGLLGLLAGDGRFAEFGLALVVPGFAVAGYVQVRLALLVPVVVLENLSATHAVRRAWCLNKGAWWRSLGVPYVVGMVASTATQVLVLPFAVCGTVVLAAGRVSALSLALGGIVTGVGLVLGLAVALPLTPVANGLLYIDRRIRREDYSTLLVAEAGLSCWGSPAPAPG
ncbi:hypothetical protein CFP65_0126 [Kitasatospora sp. MMS16-BH015]|uniref:hypothetical protein n=1 Tax=Kitasatospora sp. MMS16-BH015 TaxID=2018025 RepID=UPI000CA376D1|nr:hypothetical protein [Kitasatospora sp. MMS16-BH015]AUG75110.1 hypothetical protein CFP65_0126 [Kitasatospora sp. MMS16-BH015]